MNGELLPALLIGCALGYFAGAAAQRIADRAKRRGIIYNRHAERVITEVRG